MIVERLARRCGYDAVAGAIPESHRKLLVHIRKERTKKESRKHDDSASQVSPPPSHSTHTSLDAALAAKLATSQGLHPAVIA